MDKVYIVAAKRTAVGKFLGTLSNVPVVDLGVAVVKDILNQTKIDPSKIDELVVGNILMAGHGQGIARQIGINSGLMVETPAYGLNMICGSGLKAVMNAYNSIVANQADIIIAGGVESMSQAGYVIPAKIRSGVKMGDQKIVDHMIYDSLTDAFSKEHMGITAENVAEKLGISREEQDNLAYSSQQRAIAAIDKGNFKEEIVPIEIVTKKATTIFAEDEFVNRSTNPEKLAALKPAFKKDGTVTAGNASGINDGAAFVMVASEKAVKQYDLKPLVEIVSTGQGGVEPSVMGLGPVPAIKNAISKTNLHLKDMDVLELNEAFAAQALGVRKLLSKEYGVEESWLNERTNKNGGALALGHPVGASGCRILVSLLYEMKRQNNTYGLASLCIGGGMGTALIVKNVE
ncbi:MAG: acetyl-CoA C-acetyltransferase [Bacteroidales bacterium]|jgi:acetyl-CoA C-acetyltransferase|nr:acetyl-CoA C-acetyltransferase [Bacteroidales bacterium]